MTHPAQKQKTKNILIHTGCFFTDESIHDNPVGQTVYVFHKIEM